MSETRNVNQFMQDIFALKFDGGDDPKERLMQGSDSEKIIGLGFIRVANDSRPGWLINSKIMVELKILVVILCHDHAVVNNRVDKSFHDHDH